MTANEPSRQQEAVNHGRVAKPRTKQSLGYAMDIVDFDVFNQVERVLLYILEEPAKHGSPTPPCCECPRSPSLQRFLQLFPSRHITRLTRLRKRGCRPETTCADFTSGGTSSTGEAADVCTRGHLALRGRRCSGHKCWSAFRSFFF